MESVSIDKVAIGLRIKAARKELGLTQDELSSAAGARSKSGLQDNEAGKNMPGGQMIGALVSLGVNSNWLLTGEGEMFIPRYLSHHEPRANALTVEEPKAQYGVKRPEIDVVLLSGVIAAVDMANPQLGASERAAIAAKAYADAVQSKGSSFF